MSTPPKDEKPSILETLQAQAAELTAKIKAETDKHLATLHEKLKAAHETVINLTAEIAKHSDKPAPKKRGRKRGQNIGPIGTVSEYKATGAKRAKKGKRGAVGEAILKHLSAAGPKGAHVSDIAKAIGNDPKNVTAYFYAGAGKKSAKKVGKATFALKK